MNEPKIKIDPTYSIFKSLMLEIKQNYEFNMSKGVVQGIYHIDAKDQFFKFNLFLTEFCKKNDLSIKYMEEICFFIERDNLKQFVKEYGVEVGKFKYIYLLAKCLELFAFRKILKDGEWVRMNEVDVINEINSWADIFLNNTDDFN